MLEFAWNFSLIYLFIELNIEEQKLKNMSNYGSPHTSGREPNQPMGRVGECVGPAREPDPSGPHQPPTGIANLGGRPNNPRSRLKPVTPFPPLPSFISVYIYPYFFCQSTQGQRSPSPSSFSINFLHKELKGKKKQRLHQWPRTEPSSRPSPLGTKRSATRASCRAMLSIR